jgi:hypothetical protein
LVKENQEITDETKKLVKADIMRGMIAVVLNTDMDEDGILSDGEIQRFVSEDEEFGCYKAQGKEVWKKVKKKLDMIANFDYPFKEETPLYH